MKWLGQAHGKHFVVADIAHNQTKQPTTKMKTSAKKGKKRKKKVSLGKKEEEKEAGNERSESSGQDVVAEHPVHKSALSYGLHSSVARALVAGGITTFFPVQELAVPPIICGSYGEWGLSPDVCVSAPTGSGKTLIYVCVTLQAVCRRVVPKLVSEQRREGARGTDSKATFTGSPPSFARLFCTSPMTQTEPARACYRAHA